MIATNEILTAASSDDQIEGLLGYDDSFDDPLSPVDPRLLKLSRLARNVMRRHERTPGGQLTEHISHELIDRKIDHNERPRLAIRLRNFFRRKKWRCL
ncbi:hypothetical protein KW783_03145 [Candidatus Parcubacteria bacterium]|nr:hypothetical protein [Candidatus Parcubacteria bacterium]